MANLINDAINFVQGTYNSVLDRFNLLPVHIREQAARRASLCKSCLDAGHCSQCGCKTPEMFFAPLKKDALSKWDVMVDESEWNLYKQTHALETAQELSLLYGKIVNLDD